MPRAHLCFAPLVLVSLALGGCKPSPAAPSPAVILADDGGTGDPSDPTADELTSGGTCPAPTGAGTTHTGTISADETWTAAGSPHNVTFDVDIHANVTIEPCAVVVVGKGYHLTVGSSSEAGSLVAHGTLQVVNGARDVRPVRFTAADAAAGWAQLAVQAKGTLDLALVAIENGGAETTGARGALAAYGVAGGTNDGAPTRNLKVDRVLVDKSASYGVNLEAWGAFAEGSDKLGIRGSGSVDYPSAIRLEPGVAGTLPTTLAAVGNVKDEILLLTSKTFMRDDTLVNRGLPYRAKGTIYVAPSQDGPPVKLTVEAGVTLGFEDNVGSGILIGSSDTRQGILDAAGTADLPVVFTSAKETKAAGDWLSLYFKSTPKSGSKISYAHVEYAGATGTTTGFGCGPSDNNGAVFIHGTGADEGGPASAFIDHTTFDNIGGSTVIVSGWVDSAGPDFTNDNTFGSAIPGCKVSKPRRPGAGDVCDGGRTTCW